MSPIDWILIILVVLAFFGAGLLPHWRGLK